MKKRRIIGGILSLCIAASMWPSPLTAAAADSDTAIYVDYEAEYTPEDDIEITAQVERADTEQVLLWYRPCEEFVWKSMAMTGTAENGYSAVVARNSAWNTTLEFYVTAEYADGSSESSSVTTSSEVCSWLICRLPITRTAAKITPYIKSVRPRDAITALPPFRRFF